MMHQKIAELLVQQAKSSGSPLLSLLEGKDIQEVCFTIFQTYRGSAGRSAKGMRLSDVGLQLMKAFFKCYEVKLAPAYKISSPHLIYLDRVNKMPYWLNSSYCCMFDSELAMMLRLADGDIQTLIESRFRLSSGDDTLNADL